MNTRYRAPCSGLSFQVKYLLQVQELQMVPEVLEHQIHLSVQTLQALLWLQADHLHPKYIQQSSKMSITYPIASGYTTWALNLQEVQQIQQALEVPPHHGRPVNVQNALNEIKSEIGSNIFFLLFKWSTMVCHAHSYVWGFRRLLTGAPRTPGAPMGPVGPVSP